VKHFVQYHNVEKMDGRPSESYILTKKSGKFVEEVKGNKIWLISGDGRPRHYALCAFFIADEIRLTNESGYKYRISGKTGRLLVPEVPLDQQSWFRRFLAAQQNFSLGLREIGSPFVEELERLVA